MNQRAAAAEMCYLENQIAEATDPKLRNWLVDLLGRFRTFSSSKLLSAGEAE